MSADELGKQAQHPGRVFDKKAEEERYRRYKHLCYRNLVLKSLLSFALGILVAFLLNPG